MIVWISTQDPEERATLDGRHLLLERRAPSGVWYPFGDHACVSQGAAEHIARCRGHLPPSETLQLHRTDAGPSLTYADGTPLTTADLEEILCAKRARDSVDPFAK